MWKMLLKNGKGLIGELKMRNKFKVCLYLQDSKFYNCSGIGQAINHQKKALELNNIQYTTNPYSLDYDILHINSQLPGVLKIIRLARRHGKKIIIHAHMTSEDFKGSIIFSGILSKIIRLWLNYFYSKADLLICPTEYTQSLLKSYFLLKNKPSIAISNGVDINKWIYNKKRAEKFKKIYELKSPIILSVGLIFPRKGVADFIRVARNMPRANFIWVGKYLKNMVRDRKIWDEIKNKPDNFTLPGFVEDIIGAYSAGDIFFFPSYEENEGIVILEAAAMGKPIIVRDIPVFRTYLKDGINCLMAKNNEEFSLKINEILNNQKLKDKLSMNAKKFAESKSLKKVGRELKDIYVELLKSN